VSQDGVGSKNEGHPLLYPKGQDNWDVMSVEKFIKKKQKKTDKMWGKCMNA